jgi:hypothetical protein
MNADNSFVLSAFICVYRRLNRLRPFFRSLLPKQKLEQRDW